ncbi:MAG: DAK2 domain-containing protein [Mycoplasma sp.]|nr:DAK2 domain-containing protein [Mycoplasma sp.]
MKKITSEIFKEALISGVNGIRNDSNRIDALNVFPVPDGDTGSNMSATAKYAGEELLKKSTNTIGEVSKVFARGMLLGARGNSGVILSQIFKGVAVAFQDKISATVLDIVEAFLSAEKYAYKSVMKPVEGTILTVIRETAQGLKKQVNEKMSIEDIFLLAKDLSKKSVQNTPNLLPVLKEVGVVDSGGEGLYKIIEAISLHLNGQPTKYVEQKGSEIFLSEETYNGEFGYCTEFIVKLKDPNSFKKDKFSEALEKMGNSAVIVLDEEILKVHIHAIKPGRIISFAQKFGEFLKIKIENMNEQASENKNLVNNKEKNKQELNIAVVSCNVGQGIINDMKEYGANFIIEGGQTMNPSASDIIKAIKSVNSKQVIILPNNSNIILAAQQAAQTITDKKVIIIPTKTQMQGLAAIINFDREGKLEANKDEMNEIIETVGTIQVTKASRTTKIEGVKVTENEYLSIGNKKIYGSFSSSSKAAEVALKNTIDEDSEIVTIYYGDDSTLSDAQEVSSFIENNFDIEVEVKQGSQPIYNFLISVE